MTCQVGERVSYGPHSCLSGSPAADPPHPPPPASPHPLTFRLVHTGLFIFYATGSYLSCLGNYLEAAYGNYGGLADPVEPRHTRFVIVYGSACLFLASVYCYDLIEYEVGQPPALPGFVTQTADIIWIICVMNITSYLPPEPNLLMTTVVLENEPVPDGAPLLFTASVRSDVARDSAEEKAIRADAAWGNFDVDVLGKPPVGVDVLNSWASVALFWLTFPLHLFLGITAGAVPTIGRGVTRLQIAYAQSGIGGGPDKRNPLLVPPMIWALFMGAFNMFVKAGGQRFKLWDLLDSLQRAGSGGWFFFYDGFFRLQYDAVRELCASEQRRGRWLGATVAMCPEAVPTKLLLFLDGDHHKAVRSAMVSHLLSPAAYKPRVKDLASVLAPLLPAKRALASFVDAEGKVDTALCGQLVSRCLWFLCFGEAGLLEGEELEVVAAWNSVPKVRAHRHLAFTPCFHTLPPPPCSCAPSSLRLLVFTSASLPHPVPAASHPHAFTTAIHPYTFVPARRHYPASTNLDLNRTHAARPFTTPSPHLHPVRDSAGHVPAAVPQPNRLRIARQEVGTSQVRRPRPAARQGPRLCLRRDEQ